MQWVKRLGITELATMFPANMGPAAYNTALFFKKLRPLDFCRPTPMPMTNVEAFPRTQHIIFNSKCVLTYG